MNTHAEKTQENKSQSVVNEEYRQQSRDELTFQFVDNRPEALAQLKLKELISSSPRAREAAQFQAMADNYSAQKEHPIQKVEKTQENKSQSVLNENYRQQNKDELTFQFVDNRPKALVQLKLKELISSSPRAREAAQFQTMADNYSVQQKQNRVKPTMQMNTKMNLNDDASLEKEADVMGEKAFRVVGDLPKNVGQRKLQKIANNSPRIKQLTQLQAEINKYTYKTQTLNSSTNDVLQKMMKRPGFVGSVNTMRSDAQTMYPTENIHMAHRLSWQSIRDTLENASDATIDTMINNLTIPQRNFGDPSSGGVAAGNTEVFDAVQAVITKYGKSTVEVAKALNSSPYNLRPGDGQTNSSIGGGADAHFDETQIGEPMTPQSASLLDPSTTDSSDFMTMGSFEDWEANFYTKYVTPALTSIGKI